MIKSLIGIRIRALLGSSLGKKKNGKSNSGNKVATAVLLLFLAGIFALFFSMMALGMATTMLPLGLDALYFSIFMMRNKKEYRKFEWLKLKQLLSK